MSRRGVAAAIAGIAAVVAVVAATVVASRPTVAGALGMAVLTISLAALYRATVSGPFAPVATTFWAFVAVWAGFGPLLQIRDNRLPWPDLPLTQHYVTAQIIVLSAVVAFWFGYQRAGAPAPPSVRRVRVDRARFEITAEKAIAATAVAAALAVFCLPHTGGLAVRFGTRDDLRAALVAAGLAGGRDQALLGLLSMLPAAAALAALVLCLLCWRNRTRGGSPAPPRHTWALLAATAVAVGLNIVYNNPLSANRFVAFSTMLAAALALLRLSRLAGRAVASAGLLLGLAVLYPLANLFRNATSRQRLRLGLDAYYTFDFDSFQQTVNTVYYTDVYGHTHGRHLLSAMLFWVPRSIWEGKAVGAGNVVAASRGYAFQNLSLPFWAETYLEFSLAGVVVVFFAYGLLARRLDRTFANTRAGLGTAITIVFAACQIGLIRGPLGAQLPFAAATFALLVLGVAGWPARGRRPSRSAVDVNARVADA
jgi:hypothetical protein